MCVEIFTYICIHKERNVYVMFFNTCESKEPDPPVSYEEPTSKGTRGLFGAWLPSRARKPSTSPSGLLPRVCLGFRV